MTRPILRNKYVHIIDGTSCRCISLLYANCALIIALQDINAKPQSILFLVAYTFVFMNLPCGEQVPYHRTQVVATVLAITLSTSLPPASKSILHPFRDDLLCTLSLFAYVSSIFTINISQTSTSYHTMFITPSFSISRMFPLQPNLLMIWMYQYKMLLLRSASATCTVPLYKFY